MKHHYVISIIVILVPFAANNFYNCLESTDSLMPVTVATIENQALKNLLESAYKQGLHYHVYGKGVQYSGYATKLFILRDELKQLTEAKSLIVMFSDGYDTFVFNGQNDIMQKFRNLDAKIVFGAETSFRSREKLPPMPSKNQIGNRYLNSGFYIGYLNEVLSLLTHVLDNNDITYESNDQYHFSLVYANDELRQRFNIKLDHKSEIVFNIFHANHEGEIHCVNKSLRAYNSVYNTYPALIHANGPAKHVLGWLEDMKSKCEKENVDFSVPLPSQTISPPGQGMKYFIETMDLIPKALNSNQETIANKRKCMNSNLKMKDKLKVCSKEKSPKI